MARSSGHDQETITHPADPVGVIFSASEPFFRAAEEELRSAFTPAVKVHRLGPDAGRLESKSIDIAEVAEMCRRRPVVFVRHLMRELATVPIAADRDCDAKQAREMAVRLAAEGAGQDISLQVWVSGPSAIRAEGLRATLADQLADEGCQVARAGREHVLSVCVTPKCISVGLTLRSHSLSDWPGGRVRLAKDPHQVSRAEFKLDELFKVFDLRLPAGGRALDLGASPGGWTRVLRRRGFTVWAVDPAELSPRLTADPKVHHMPTTAGNFLAETGLTFDVVVNDMRMTPARSCEVMLDAAHRLEPGGLAVMTLKVSPHGALPEIQKGLQMLERSYEVLFARQLYHNRNEVTVVVRRNGRQKPSAPTRRRKRRSGAR
ncbi:MAG: SAM-dependent methyltransferase [Egibacteraceae bacterium]